MSFTLPDSLLKSAAFKLFLEEIAKHMSAATERIKTGAALNADECKRLGAAFHTIRGSAGFFNLQDLSRLAEQLEAKLLADDLKVPFDVGNIVSLVQQLQSLTDKILAAGGSEHAQK